MINTILEKLNSIILSLIFGGSIGVLFSVLTNIHIAKLSGIAVKVAANNNAPIFIAFSKFLLILGLAFLILSLITKNIRRKLMVSLPIILCILSIMLFSLYIAPQMDLLRPQLTSSETARLTFESLHKLSQFDFSLIILTSLICLVQLPIKKTG